MSEEKKLLARVMPLAEEYAMFPAGGTVLCCVSGGVDSMSLLHFLAGQSVRLGFQLHACHFDHGIRPESDADAEFVRAQCGARNIPLHAVKVDVPYYAKAHGLGLEEAGRKLRYDWFHKVADRFDDCVIATAHHADDNAETLLLHLVRGSGLSGLGGIPPRRGRLVRPFLNVPRALIESYAAEEGIPFVEDATNADPDYTPRNLLRHRVMPLLRQMNPNLTDTLSATAASLRQDGEFLSARAANLAMDATVAAGSVILPLASVNGQSAAIAARVIQAAAEKLEPELVLTARQRRMVLELCRGSDPSAHCDLPRGISAQRVYDSLVFSFPGRVEILPETELDFTGTRDIGPYTVTVGRAVRPEDWTRSDGAEFYLSAFEPVVLRKRKTGDELKLPGREGTKSVKKWMIERRIPEARRDLIPVLDQLGRCAAVWSIGIDAAAVPAPGQPCLHITIKEKERNQTV